MMRQTLVMALVATAAMAGQANAGVKGGHFEGTLYYADGSEANFVSADFYDNDTFVENDDEGVIVPYPGTYDETDFLFVSSWTAEFTGIDNYEVTGISLFSRVSLYTVNQIDGDNDYSGIVWRRGDAEEAVDTPQ